MLISNGASVIYTNFITAAVLVGVNAELTTGVLDVVPRLHSQLRRIQYLDLIPISSRLVLLCDKAWTQDTWLYIPLTLTTQAGLLLLLDVGTIRGVILFGIFTTIPHLFLNLYMTYEGLKTSAYN